jgi:predicted amidophosphoribosyltransferase
LYRLKYRSDKTALPTIVETVGAFIRNTGIDADVIVPVPASKTRAFQPVVAIAKGLSDALRVPLDCESVRKARATPQMKDVGDFAERLASLEGAFEVGPAVNGKRVLLIDDLLQSGATMNVVAGSLKTRGQVKAVYAIALTRTRG